MTNNQAGDAIVEMSLPNRLALERTRGAYERTMMAWVRTSMSLITFGFSVYKFFNLNLHETSALQTYLGPREFGLILIIIGLFTLFLGTFEHRRDMKSMQKEYPGMPHSMTLVLAMFIAPLGIMALLAVIFRF
jgi:putative membrane protein